jgi:hypothetical protein
LAEPSSNAAESELRRVLDEEVFLLPRKYQTPVVLCYLEGKTNEEAAEQLGCPTGTVVTWLARARRRLRGRLEKRGLTITTGAMTALPAGTLDPWPARAAVLEHAIRIGSVSTFHQAAATGLVSAKVAALTQGALKAMMMSKLKIAFAVFLTLGLAGAGASATAFYLRDLPARDAVTLIGSDESKGTDADDTGKAKKASKEKVKPSQGGQSEKIEEVQNVSIKTSNAPTVVVDLTNGAIEIEATAEGEVSVKVTKQAQAVTQEAAREAMKHLVVDNKGNKDKVTVTATRDQEKLNEASVGASASIKVPAGAVLELKSHNGGVKVKGGKGSLVVHTSNGAIEVAENRSTQHLSTRNGAIIVTGATGKLELETNNGRLAVQATNAVVQAMTHNGEVKFEGSLAAGDHKLRTNNGGVSLTLPADSQFRIDAQTHHGSIQNGFEVRKSGTESKSHLTGTVGNEPSTSIKIETHNGSIQIQPKK